MSTTSVHVLLVEDDPDTREALHDLLRCGGFAVTACADGAAALAALSPSVQLALVDLGLPDRPGEQLIRDLRKLRPRLPAVVLTAIPDRARMLAALRAGASGYLLKDAPLEQVVAAVHEALAGGAPMSPQIARQVVQEFHTPVDPALTAREEEVLALLATGATYAEIGQALRIGTGTVQTHIKSLYAKLGIGSKAEAATEAWRRGLIR